MGHVFRTEEQQAAVDGLKRFLDAEIDPIFSKQYRDKFVPRDKMAEITYPRVAPTLSGPPMIWMGAI